MKIKVSLIKNISYLYILSPIIVFALGFMRLQYGIILSAAVCAVIYFVIKQNKSDMSKVSVDKRTVIVMCIVIPLLMLVCGQCGIFAQTPDWHGRNAQLSDLVNNSWPVYYSDGSAYTYYFGFFLIPAVFGKIFGLHAAWFVQFLISVAGMMLIYLYLIKITKADTFRKQMFVLIVFLFFGNFEDLRFIVADVVTGIIRYFNPLYTEPSYILMWTPNARSFALVFNQVIASFLVMSMFLDDEPVENFVVMGVGLILFSPFMLLFFALFAVIAAVKLLIKDTKKALKRIFSPQNIIVLTVLPVLFLFFVNNVTADKPESLMFQFVNFGADIWYYIIFVLCEFLLFSAVIMSKYKRNPYFWAVNIALLLLPFFKLGLWNDLNSRSSSMGMFVIMIMCISFLFDKDKKIAKPRMKSVLCALLVGASLCPMNWYMDIIKSTADKFAEHKMEECVANDYITYEKIWERNSTPDNKYNYFTFDAKEKFFFKYIAKPNKNLK